MAIFRSQQRVEPAAGLQRATPVGGGGPVMAASTQSVLPDARYVIVGVALVLFGAVVGWLLYRGLEPADFVPKSDYSVFAGLFILAAALERLLEPFSRFAGPDTAKSKTEVESKVATAGQPDATQIEMQDAAESQATLDRQRNERALVMWGLASALAILACSLVGVFMLRAVADVPRCDPKAPESSDVATVPGLRTPQGCTENDPNRFVDLVATGLVVGAGTKPLHDLVTRIQAKKEKAVDPPETKGG